VVPLQTLIKHDNTCEVTPHEHEWLESSRAAMMANAIRSTYSAADMNEMSINPSFKYTSQIPYVCKKQLKVEKLSCPRLK
jgi:hypothetical protein